MRATLLAEPELQFGRGRHVDPRFGLLELGPADGQAPAAPRTIATAVVGTQETIEGVVRWLTRCRNPIAERADAKRPRTRLASVVQRDSPVDSVPNHPLTLPDRPQ